jgi:multiple sugar transport system substrate-binding protein
MTIRTSRRRFLQFASVTTAAALAACAFPVTPVPAEEGDEEGAIPSEAGIQMEAWSQASGIFQDSTEEILDLYNKQNDNGARVEFVYIPQTQGSQSSEKLLTAVAGGNPPALYNADRFTVPQFAYQGFFTNINDFAEASGVTSDQYFDFAWDETVYKGDIYALSVDTDARALWYNKDIMLEAGLDPDAPPTNVDELRAATDALTERGAGGAITRYGFNPLYDQAWLYTWGFGFQGEFQDSDGRITFSHPNNVAAMEFVKEFVDEIGVQDIDAMLAACAGSACNDQNDYFWTGQAAMTCSGTWKVAQMHRYRPDGNFGVAPMPGPEGPAPYASWAGGFSWCVPEGNEDVASAFDVCAYLCGEESQLKYTKDTGRIPTMKAAAEDSFYREDPLHAVFMDLLPVSNVRPPIPFGSKLWDLQVTAFRDEIPHGTKTPEQALLDIDTEINADLESIGFFS